MFKGAVIWKGNFLLSNTDDGRVDVIEGFFIDAADDFAADAVRLPTFFHNDGAIGFLERFEHGFHVERAQGAQVNDLGFNALLAEFVGGFYGELVFLAVGVDAEFLARALNFGFSNGNGVFALGHVTAHLVHGGMFDEKNRIIRTDG